MKRTPKLRIHVTAKDIREGVRNDCGACPIARAVARAVKRVIGIVPDHVTVLASTVAQIPDGDDWRYLWWASSEAMWRFIHDFDDGLTVTPRSFILTPGGETL